MKRRITGDIGFRKLLKRLPDDAREEMAEALEQGGQELLNAMRADVPVRSGALKRGLKMKLLKRSLKLKVGLLGVKSNSKLFYGRIIEYGRKSRTVTVHRRRNGVNTGLRGGRKKAEDVATTYQLTTKARAPHPFVYKKRGQLRAVIGDRLRNYWTRILNRAAAGHYNDG